MAMPKSNGSKIGLYISIAALLFGTNFFGGCLSQYIRAEAAAKKIVEISENVSDNTQAVAGHNTDIAVIETKLENLEKGQEEIKTLIRNNK